jgi:type VI secretion system protein ImpG
MSAVFNTYFQDELRYLREVGPEFTRANPDLARHLADAGTDPDVDRLLEGVAFLCGRVRQKLDDELPELTESLMDLLWPHYLRPVPSMTIMELLPDLQAMQAAVEVPAGAEFASRPVDGTRCRYRSAWPLMLRPMVVRDLRLETAAGQPVRLVVVFQAAPKAKWANLALGRLRLHLAGDAQAAFALYLLLAAHTGAVTVSNGRSGAARQELTLPPGAVSAAGLADDEGVLPYPPYMPPGYRLVQEYFAFKERFLFVDVCGLDRVVGKLELADTVEVAFTFDRRLESFPLVSTENVRLHCVPAANLFPHPAEPLRLQHDRVRYLVQPARAGISDRRHAEIYAIERVYGLVRTGDVAAHEFRPFYSFAHTAGAERSTATYYQMHRAPSTIGSGPRWGTDMFLSFVVGGQPGAAPAEETVSLELTCTNRDLPGELRAGDINEATDASPTGVRFRNLLKPTAAVRPPLGGGLHWRLISHLALNYVSLMRAAHFKELLRIYDFQAVHDAQRALALQRLLDGIVDLNCEYRQRMVRGAPTRGIHVTVGLNDDHFAGEGDAYLFAAMLDRFVAGYVTLNAASQVDARLTRTGRMYRFPTRWGAQPTPAEVRDAG